MAPSMCFSRYSASASRFHMGRWKVPIKGREEEGGKELEGGGGREDRSADDARGSKELSIYYRPMRVSGSTVEDNDFYCN